MVETITPVVHGGRRFRYLRSVAIHTLAATVAAGTVGLLLGALGALVGGPWSPEGPMVLGAIAAIYAARELFRLPIPLPDRKAQVPAWWRSFYGPDVTAALYGFGLGPGFLTYLTFGTYAAVLAGSFIAADPLLGALISAPFGFARGLSILVGMRATDEEMSAVIADRLTMAGVKPPPRLINALALLMIAVVAFV